MFKIVDKEGNIHGTETDYGNAAELWMVLEEMLGIKLSIVAHKYDKRGRIYCQGYAVTYQGNDWNKACIEFAEGEYLNIE